MTIEKIQFTHRAYVWFLFTISQNDATWIGMMLRQGCAKQFESAFKTMEELGFETFTEETFELAGEMILNNEKLVIN